MHVESSRRPHVRKDGTEVVYQSHLLRRSFRTRTASREGDAGQPHAVAGRGDRRDRAVLSGKTLVDAADAVAVTRRLPHGDVALVMAQAGSLGFPLCLDRQAASATWRWR